MKGHILFYDSKIKMSSENQIEIAKATKKNIVNDLCNTIDLQRQTNKGRVPMGFVAGLIKSHLSVCPWLTRDTLNNELRRRKRLGSHLISSTNASLVTTSVTDIVVAAPRTKGGRPSGTTDVKKKNSEMAIIAAKNEICLQFDKDKKRAGKKRLERGYLTKLISHVKLSNGLGEDADISKACIRQRYKKARLFLEDSTTGPVSPLRACELEFVQVMTQMAKMRQSLSPSQAINLINSMIDGTQTQLDLIEFKNNSSHGGNGTIGIGYWKGFKHRNEHLIVSKRGGKYELDRDKWTTYANFYDMYNHIYDEMVDANVASIYEDPMWQDCDGTRCNESNSFGCKVTHNLTHPEMCIVMDEVGGNTSQKGDGHIGGELLVCGKGMIPQKKINTKDKHFTLLGLTSLAGDPVMCVIIFAGLREQAVIETGMDVFAQQEGEVSDDDFFVKNSGSGKRFPGGPTCTFQGKEVACLTRWSPKGSITSDILIDIVSSLDYLEVFDRSNGRQPLLLLDGHGSRFALDFLRYVTHPDHQWCVCIGVPYGTALWQVGDSSEQNGAYKIALAKAKEDLIERKQTKMMSPTIEPFEIVPLVNTAWAHSFARPLSNKKAIAERGWYPLNRNLLLDTTLRATMTEEEKTLEIGRNLIPNTLATTLATTNCTPTTNAPSTPCFELNYLTAPPTEPREKMNYSSGTAALCLDSIVRHGDLMNARERIKRERNEGKTITERIKEQRGAVTAGKLFNAGACRIGKTVFDLVNANAENNRIAAKEKGDAARLVLLQKVDKANTIRALNKPNSQLNNEQLKILCAALKRDGDKAIPTLKADLLSRLREWEARGAVVVEEAVALVVAKAANELRSTDEQNEISTDVIGMVTSI